MKRTKLYFLFILFTFGFLMQGNAQQIQPEPAQQILDKALIQANETHKRVFVIFHASWCTWCHLLDSAMNDPACKKLFENRYEIRHIAIMQANSTPEGSALYSKYKGAGLPFYVILDEQGQEQVKSLYPNGSVIGYPGEEDSWKVFAGMLSKTSNLNDDQLRTIKTVIDFKKAQLNTH